MNKLKQLSSFSLALSLMLGSMVSASFTDYDSIETTEAIDTLVALGVIHGMPDGSFSPLASVTRAEMAKMIYIIKNGGVDNSSNFVGFTSFEDVKGHWAEGYIAYCQSQGIIAGKSETVFSPNEAVSGVDAFKMVLVALGYDAEIEGLVGSDYVLKTLSLIGNLADDYNQTFSESAQRQYAAQMLYNALDAEMIKYSNNVAEKTGYTLGENALGLSTATVDILFDVVKDSTFTAIDNKEDIKLKVEADYTKYLGQSVEIKYNTKNGNIYSIASNYDSVEVAKNSDDFEIGSSENILEIGDLTINLSNNSEETFDEVYVILDGETLDVEEFNTFAKLEGLFNQKDGFGSTMTVYENAKNLYSVVINTYKVAEVTSISNDRINASGYYYFDKEEISSEITRGDFVKITTDLYNDNLIIEVIKSTKGMIDGKKDELIRVNGEWIYLTSANVASTGDEIEFYLVNNVAHKVSITGETSVSNDYLVVKESASYDARYDEYYVKVLFKDGTQSTIVVDEVLVDGVVYENSDILTILNGTGIYTFDISNNIYSLNQINEETENALKISTISDDVITSETGEDVTIYDDALVFVQYTKSGASAYSYDVISGTDLINWDTTTSVEGDISYMLVEKVNGLDYTTVAFINLGSADIPVSKIENNYAIVTEESYQIQNSSGDVVYTFEIFDGEENIVVESTSSNAKNVSKGDIVEFDLATNGITLDNLRIVDQSNLQDAETFAYYAVTGYNGSDVIVLESNTSEIVSKRYTIDTNDTTIMYIDSSNFEGYDEGKIELANEDNGSYTENVKAVVDQNGLILLLVVDVNGAYVGGIDAYGDEIK